MRSLAFFVLFALSASGSGAPLNFRPKAQAFEPNLGQCDPAVRFLARFPGYVLFLTEAEAVFLFPGGGRPPSRHELPQLLSHPTPDASKSPTSVLRLRWIGPAGAARVQPHGSASLPGYSNYLRGNDPARWIKKVPHFSQVDFPGLFPGTDLVFYGREGGLEFDWRLRPGVRVAGLEMELSGQKSMELGPEGSLQLELPGGRFSFKAPAAYQEVPGGRIPVEIRYSLRDGNRVGFDVGPCDPSLPIVIDPFIDYATFVGGGGFEWLHAVAADAEGKAYVVGFTTSVDYPTQAALRSSTPSIVAGHQDAVLSVLDPTGSFLIYSTYLGGSDNEDALAVVVDSSGSATVGGTTTSVDFPVVNAFQGSYGGASSFDGFLCKLAPDGGSFIFSTYLGGSDNDAVWGLAQSGSGDIYATGYTFSANFPVSAGLSPAGAGGPDVFVVKASPTGALMYSTCQIKGSLGDFGYAVAVDLSGCAYVTGKTDSANFPVLGALQATNFSGGDAFVSKLNPTGSALLFSTFLGGSGTDVGESIAVDTGGAVSVAGFTQSGNFPVLNPFQGANGGGDDGFVCRLSPTGAALLFSTYLGGSNNEEDSNLAMDAVGNIFVGTSTYSPNFPVTSGSCPACGPSGVEDLVLSEFDSTGTLLFSRFFGAIGHLEYESLGIDSTRNIYMVGMTPNVLPATAGAFQTASGGNQDGFVVKFGEFYQSPTSTPTPTQTVNPALTPTLSPTMTVSATFSASPSPSLSPTVTRTPTLRPTPSITPTPTPPPLPLTLRLYPSSPNPSTGTGSWLTFLISTPARISVTIYTVAGEEVTRLPSADYPAGVSETFWNNHNSADALVASGIFIFKLSALSPAGERNSDFGKCSVVR
jgi:hypothetical protein